MAQARDAGPAFHPSRAAEYAEIERWYRDLLDRTTPPTDLVWEPIKIGPTWQWDDESGWLLPEATLGWGFLSWTGYWLTGRGGKPWTWTAEQARMLLWYYAVDTHGDSLFHTYRLQRLKGWGKDPTASGIAAGSLHAPIVFDHWDGDRPVGRSDQEAWTQILAVALEQTKNTMKLFPGLIPQETRDHYGIQIGKQNVWSDGDRRQIEAVTNSVLAIEGGRPKQVIRAEIQNWISGNGGHEMVEALEGNAAKAELGAPARILDIFNAYRPGRDSVAERARVNYDDLEAAGIDPTANGVCWDSLEAPPEAPLTAKDAPDVVRSVAGDATWLDTRPNGRIVKSILNPDNSTSESRRKWYNQITGAEDAWVDPRWVDSPENRRPEEKLADGERVVLFGDGSKSGDDTGLVAIRVSDGMAFTLHHQHPADGQLVDRAALDAAVTVAFDKLKVVAFWFDPSHAKADDQVEEDRFWWPLVDDWHRRYHRRLDKKFWPVKTGPKAHAVAFDMTTTAAQQLFQPAVTQLADDLREGRAPHHGGGTLRRHAKNAKRREGRFGVTVGKENRSSPRKIDLAVCWIGGRMLWRLVTMSRPKSPGKGRVVVHE
ncbi:terminase [Nocardioides fonticola]|uniref:Terminase n=1 Tax=Nocardioides fonticola TaxID=450363 RepID=A0ABP7XPD6_9ACTN